MQQLFIFRHGETEWNVQERMQGRLDSPLTEQGRQQADRHGALVKALGGLERLWVSPLGRTTETAYVINSYAQAELIFSDALVERDCGAWGGMTIQQIKTRFPEQWAARDDNPYSHRPPGGENMQDMLQRVQEFLDELFADNAERIGLVTHGVMSKVILQYFLGLSEVEAARVRHPNGLVYRLSFNPQQVESHHFIDGGSPVDGLLRRDPQLANLPQSQ